MRTTEQAKQDHSETCYGYALQNAIENWTDSTAVDLYALDLYGDDGDTATGPFATAYAEVESWAAAYLANGDVDCQCDR